MPFVGVLPERRHLFEPQPQRAVAVSDSAAWRLNPEYRHIYDKLRLALDAGLVAAPCGVAPDDLGVAPEDEVFVKPITNLAGMGLNARTLRADGGYRRSRAVSGVSVWRVPTPVRIVWWRRVRCAGLRIPVDRT